MTIWKPRIGREKPRYLAILRLLEEDVRVGRLKSGDRLPTHRELASTLGVAIGTVTRAYASAMQRGLVRGEIGRGTFVGLESKDLEFGKEGEKGSIDFGATWPLYGEDPDLAPALRRLTRERELASLLRYQPNAGMSAHRAAGARWIERYGLAVDPEQVLVCGGSQHALTVLASFLAQPGDVVLCEALTYPGIRAVADMLSLKLVGVPMDEEGLRPDALERACRQKRPKALYCTASIQNPTTATLSAERRERIASIAMRYEVPIIEDAIHHLLLEDAPPLLSSFAPETSYLIAAPSKVVAGGLRVAFVAAPKGSAERIAQRIWATCWMVAPLSVEIFNLWIQDGTADETVRRKKAEAAQRVRIAREGLAGFSLKSAPAGFHTWLELPPQWESAASFAAAALRSGVLVTPSDAFHVGTGPAPRAVRVSLSPPRTRDLVKEGIRRLSEVLSQPPGPGPAIL